MRSKDFFSEIKEFFQKIGYKYIRRNKNEFSRGNEYFKTEEFVREVKNGRYHIYVAKGYKSSGWTHNPRIKIFGHFDIFKPKNGKIRHFTDKTEKRITGEMYRIDKELVKSNIGFMEHKDKHCAHTSLEINDPNKVLETIKMKGYEIYDKGKFKRKVNSYQYSIQLIKKGRFLYVICVCAFIEKSRKHHSLKKEKAEEELKRLTFQIILN